MPLFNLSTNVKLDEAQIASLFPELVSCIAKNIGKPEYEVMIVLKESVSIVFSGSTEAAAYGELVSVGAGYLTPDANQKITSGLAELLEAKLNIPKIRFFLKFFDSPGSMFGWNGNVMA
ncbi:decarboxylase [Lithospermum erythrorhizon]|uniref:Decarboxylase n=1 Tax=Lithospermum erythrorhizon TaxID=34254 RepID=A0AAV3QTP4_LITER